MYSPRQHADAEKIARETGMGFIQALAHVKQRDELRNRLPARYQSALRPFDPSLITVIA